MLSVDLICSVSNVGENEVELADKTIKDKQQSKYVCTELMIVIY